MTPEIPQVIKDHWAGLISGGGLVHFLHIAWPWLKANNGLRGVWGVVWGKPVVPPSQIPFLSGMTVGPFNPSGANNAPPQSPSNSTTENQPKT